MTILYRGRKYVALTPERGSRLVDQPGIEGVVDTADRGDLDIPGIGRMDDGVLTSYHVTDQIDETMKALQAKRNVVKGYGAKGGHAELGPGLYMSGAPGLWLSRSRGKYDFLTAITKDQLRGLGLAIVDRLDAQRETGYISPSEFENGEQTVADALSLGHGPILTTFAGQPYNIDFWKPDFLEPLGIEAADDPMMIEVGMRGRFAALTGSYLGATVYRMLRRAGIDGAYTKSTISTNPELVLWNVNAIVSLHKVKVP